MNNVNFLKEMNKMDRDVDFHVVYATMFTGKSTIEIFSRTTIDDNVKLMVRDNKESFEKIITAINTGKFKLVKQSLNKNWEGEITGSQKFLDNQ
jgi:arginine deiminase